MAIAKMKRLTIVSEPQNVESLLEHLQEVKETHITPFDALVEEDQNFFKEPHNLVEDRISDEMRLRELRDMITFLKDYVPPKNWRHHFKERLVYSLEQLEQTVKSLGIESLLFDLEKQRSELSCIQKDLQSLEEQELFLRQWQSLDLNPKIAKELSHFDVHYGTIPTEQQDHLKTALGEWDANYFIDDIFYSKDLIGYVIVTEKSLNKDLMPVLRQYQWFYRPIYL